METYAVLRWFQRDVSYNFDVCGAGDIAISIGSAGRGFDVRAVLCAAAGASHVGPRPRRCRVATRRHAAARVAAKTTAY